MGRYLNPGTMNFRINQNGKIYIDKSRLIVFTNDAINTPQRFICVSRPRRFGKSFAADMLAAYYVKGMDTQALFQGMEIAKTDSFHQHRNQYNVIQIDMQKFMTENSSVTGMIQMLSEFVLLELKKQYPEILFRFPNNLSECLADVFYETEYQFVMLIDEWDCVIRRYYDQEEQKKYLDFLRNLMKDQPYIALAYMTGILPIKKYGEHSALNMFCEYSMFDSAEISDCFGFTEQEVAALCEHFGMDFQEAKEWYDGYHFVIHPLGDRKEYSVYSPKSVVESMLRKKYEAYWNQTERYEALKDYIQMNFDGLKDAVIEMLSGGAVSIDTGSFQNDMINFHNKDDILTLMVHLGYLTYNQDMGTVSIPNKEVSKEFVSSIKNIESWSEVALAVQNSQNLLKSLWNMDGEAVASGIEKVHCETSALKYNDENSLSCIVALAFYYAKEYYTIIREMPTGKGFADICFIPKPNHGDKPAVIIELKYNKTAISAIRQIKSKNYPDALKSYHGNLLLCGISYDDKKKHSCIIERMEMVVD